jgi:hypothetical protein
MTAGVFFYTSSSVIQRLTFAFVCFAGKASHFDLLRKPSFTVPMYADKLGLLVFGALLHPGH